MLSSTTSQRQLFG